MFISFLFHHVVFDVVDMWTIVNWMDFYLWYCVQPCCNVLLNNQILMVDTKRQQQTNLKITIEYPLWARNGVLTELITGY